MKFHSNPVFPIILLLLAFGYDISAQNWKFIKEVDGIKIYTRQQENSPVKGFKGELNLDASPEKLQEMITDVKNFDKWDEDVKEMMVFYSEKNKGYKYYLVFDVPWPLTDRDLCLEAKIESNPSTGIITITSQPLFNAIPEKPDKVRITKYSQKWTIQPLGNGQVHLVLEGFVDPAGSIPAWLINMVIANTPLNILKAVREHIGK
jgi:hypothetical protein